jgi:hypothetical protein
VSSRVADQVFFAINLGLLVTVRVKLSLELFLSPKKISQMMNPKTVIRVRICHPFKPPD